jgi:hypothetical protein
MIHHNLDDPLDNQEQLLAMLRHLVSPLLTELRGNLQACGRMRLTVHFDGSAQEGERAFLFPTADYARVMLALQQLLTKMRWERGATALEVTMDRIQDVVAEQLPLIAGEAGQERKLREVQHYLAARFGADRLRRAVLSQPSAPLPEWRVDWLSGEES